MSDLRIKDIVTLEDDREYVVTSIAKIDGFVYLYLVEIENYVNIKFCKLISHNNSIGLQEINDNNTLAKIMPELSSSLIEAIS